MEKKNISMGFVFTALFAALTASAFFVQIPLPGGIPIILQDMMAMLCGLLLGPVYGGAAVLLFLLLGVMGLPVFSGKAGISVLVYGPTCGFLWGCFAAAVIAGLFLKLVLKESDEESKAKKWIMVILACVLATVIVFAMGIVGFMKITGSSIEKTIAAVVVPFIPGNLIKIFIMVNLTRKFRSKIKSLIEGKHE